MAVKAPIRITPARLPERSAIVAGAKWNRNSARSIALINEPSRFNPHPSTQLPEIRNFAVPRQVLGTTSMGAAGRGPEWQSRSALTHQRRRRNRRSIRQTRDPEVGKYIWGQVLQLREQGDGKAPDLHVRRFGRPHSDEVAPSTIVASHYDRRCCCIGQNCPRGLSRLLAGKGAIGHVGRPVFQCLQQLRICRSGVINGGSEDLVQLRVVSDDRRLGDLGSVGRQITLRKLRIGEVPMSDQLVRHRARNSSDVEGCRAVLENRKMTDLENVVEISSIRGGSGDRL